MCAICLNAPSPSTSGDCCSRVVSGSHATFLCLLEKCTSALQAATTLVQPRILDDEDINNEIKNSQCQRCKTETCNCKSKSTKPWLSENASSLQQIQSSDLTTADILEREVKNKKGLIRSEQRQKDESEPKRLSPFSEMSRRDEGDGRSIADSYSSSYKNQFLTYHPADKKNSKPNAKIRTIPTQRRNLPN